MDETQLQIQHQKLTDAVDSFLWMSSYTRFKDTIVSVQLHHANGVASMGTQSFENLERALNQHGSKDAVTRK